MRSINPDSWEDCLYWFEDVPEMIDIMNKQKAEIVQWAREADKSLREGIEWFHQLEKARRLNRERGQREFLLARRKMMEEIQEREGVVREWLAARGERLEDHAVYTEFFTHQKTEVVKELLQAKIPLGAIIRCTEIAPQEIMGIRLQMEEEKALLKI